MVLDIGSYMTKWRTVLKCKNAILSFSHLVLKLMGKCFGIKIYRLKYSQVYSTNLTKLYVRSFWLCVRTMYSARMYFKKQQIRLEGTACWPVNQTCPLGHLGANTALIWQYFPSGQESVRLLVFSDNSNPLIITGKQITVQEIKDRLHLLIKNKVWGYQKNLSLFYHYILSVRGTKYFFDISIITLRHLWD